MTFSPKSIILYEQSILAGVSLNVLNHVRQNVYADASSIAHVPLHHSNALFGAGGRCAGPPFALHFVTYRNTHDGTDMTDATLPDLGDLEREVMQLVWANGRVTAEAVREKLSRRLKESTVRTVLRRLEEKRYVTHTVEGRTYVYEAAQARSRVAARAVQRIVDWFCNGSVEEVLVGMVDTAMVDQRQLRMLADKVAKAKPAK
jgi:BlaI family penicillinase repressor